MLDNNIRLIYLSTLSYITSRDLSVDDDYRMTSISNDKVYINAIQGYHKIF